MTAQELNFGSYDVFDSQALNGVGNIVLSCDLDTGYSIALSQGSSGSYDERAMLDGSDNSLGYNLYKDVSRSLIWGDGSGGSTTESGTATSMEITHAVYGRIPAQQNVRAGNYVDSVVVTVNF